MRICGRGRAAHGPRRHDFIDEAGVWQVVAKDKELLVFCQVGLRGYLACRILNQRGFSCRNLTGGYKTYCATLGIDGGQVGLAQDMHSDTGETGSQKKKT